MHLLCDTGKVVSSPTGHPSACRVFRVRCCAVLLAGLFACAPFKNDELTDGPYTSVPAPTGANDDTPPPVETPVGSPNSAGDANVPASGPATPNNTSVGNPNATSPNATTPPPVDPRILAILAQTNARAVYGVGFALEAFDYPGYCVAAANASLATGTALRLAQCANVEEQSWGWSKGQFALDKRMCVTGSQIDGDPALLRACSGGNQQIWSLAFNSQRIYQTRLNTTTTQRWTLDPARFQAASLLTKAATGAEDLRLVVSPLPQTDGIRIHAKVGNVDLCLADLDAGLKLVGCNAEANQVWRMVAEQWRSALGRCLIGDAASGQVRAGACSSRPTSNARWYLTDGHIALVSSFTAAGAPVLALDVDADRSAPKLSSSTNLVPLYAIGAPTGVF